MSIYIMLIGSLIATSHDLSANSLAYTFIFLNNLSTCANNIILKQKLTLQVNKNLISIRIDSVVKRKSMAIVFYFIIQFFHCCLFSF